MNIFAYGTLMDADIMSHVSGVTGRGTNAVLEGYARYRVSGEQYPGIVPEGGGKVEGMVYFDISADQVRRLDIFEGEMYSREKIKVKIVGENTTAEVMAYVVKPEHVHFLTRKPWDFEGFLKEGKRLFEEDYYGFDELQESSR